MWPKCVVTAMKKESRAQWQSVDHGYLLVLQLCSSWGRRVGLGKWVEGVAREMTWWLQPGRWQWRWVPPACGGNKAILICLESLVDAIRLWNSPCRRGWEFGWPVSLKHVAIFEHSNRKRPMCSFPIRCTWCLSMFQTLCCFPEPNTSFSWTPEFF